MKGDYDGQVFVRNLTDQYTFAAGIVATNFTVVPGARRTYGVTREYHY